MFGGGGCILEESDNDYEDCSNTIENAYSLS